MNIDELKLGDAVYWKSKTRPRIGTKQSIHKGKYQGKINDKILVYWENPARIRGWSPDGKTIEINFDQLVDNPE
jgi:hypothetical protein